KRLHDNGVMVNGSFVFGMDGDGPDVFDRTVEWAVARSIGVTARVAGWACAIGGPAVTGSGVVSTRATNCRNAFLLFGQTMRPCARWPYSSVPAPVRGVRH